MLKLICCHFSKLISIAKFTVVIIDPANTQVAETGSDATKMQ